MPSPEVLCRCESTITIAQKHRDIIATGVRSSEIYFGVGVEVTASYEGGLRPRCEVFRRCESTITIAQTHGYAAGCVEAAESCKEITIKPAIVNREVRFGVAVEVRATYGEGPIHPRDVGRRYESTIAIT